MWVCSLVASSSVQCILGHDSSAVSLLLLLVFRGSSHFSALLLLPVFACYVHIHTHTCIHRLFYTIFNFFFFFKHHQSWSPRASLSSMQLLLLVIVLTVFFYTSALYTCVSFLSNNVYSR